MRQSPATNGNLAREQKRTIVIEAAKRPEAQKLRVAAYCRVSSDSSDQLNSFMAQMHYYTALIQSKENWTLTDLYADGGVTGTSAEKRPEFQRLLLDCRRGCVDKILVKSISRFARNTKDCLKTVRELKALGVGVYFEEQNIDTANTSGEMLTTIFAAIAEKESISISENMRWSYQRRMQSGTFIPPSLPYGYIHQGRDIAIDQKAAEIVRRVFAEYLSGHSAEQIAAGLSKDKVPCRYGGTDWNAMSVLHLLTNEKYTGDSLWQKYYTTETLPFHCKRNRGEREAYFAEDTHEGIISRSDFEAVQRLAAQRGKRIAAAQHLPYPFRRKIYCGNCGTVFRRKVVRGVVYWSCMGHDKRGQESCATTQIPEEALQAAFLRVYHKLKLHGEMILQQLVRDLRSVREHRMLWNPDVVELNKRICEITDQDRMLAEMNRLGLVDPDIFIAQSNELAWQLCTAKQEKERILGAGGDDAVSKTQDLLETLETMPEFLPDFDGEVFSELVKRITADERDIVQFHLQNGLALSEPIERRMR